ncbi:MAG TPA: DUF72 domain-containing protein [Candidatus Acidoferrum sp.]|nr:DUF72 domain-containing protein [Candidatus Acidoferrum sp.]
MTHLLRIGCCGPARLSLKTYSEKFDLVEIQSSFYRLPRLETAQRWRQTVPRKFEFTLKAFQGITHPAGSPTWRRNARAIQNVKPEEVGLLRLTDFTRRSWNETVEVANVLEAKVVVVQMPPSFEGNEANLHRIGEFFGTVETRMIPAIEFRHETWEDRLERVSDLMRGYNGLVVTDPLKMKVPDQLMQYHRLHGTDGFTNYKHRYSDGELKQLMSKLGSKETYVLFNNLGMREDAERFSKLTAAVSNRVGSDGSMITRHIRF